MSPAPNPAAELLAKDPVALVAGKAEDRQGFFVMLLRCSEGKVHPGL